MSEQAPEQFNVKFETTSGDFTVEVTRGMAPNGVDRFYHLVKNNYFTDIAFFRHVPNFIVQFGIHGDPQVSQQWRGATIKDDPVKQTNDRGTLTFATAGPNTRTVQLFINFKKNDFLDGQGFSPFAKVTEGMDVVESINGEYGEQPDQGQLQSRGNAYLKERFPNLDYVKSASVME